MTPQELLEELDIPFVEEGHEHCRDGWVQLDCPSCSPNTQHWRLGFNIAYGYVNCWHCGRLGLAETLAESSGRSRSQVRSLLGGLERRSAPRRERVRGTLKLPEGLAPLRKAHRRYLESRRLDPDEIVSKWEVQGIGLAVELSWRLFIPIHYHGDVVSWTTRSIADNHKLRYRSAGSTDEAIPHKTLLYGEDYARHSIVIVEGPIDAWTIGPGCVATCGTGLMGNAQLARIAKYPVRAICFDSEPKAQSRARDLMRQLRGFPGKTFNVELESGKDANDCLRTSYGRREVREIRKRFLT